MGKDEVLRIFLELILNLVHDACEEAFILLTVKVSRASIVCEDFENFFSYELPFCGIIWILEHFKHLFEPSVSDSLVCALVFDHDVVSDETKSFVLKDVEEQISIQEIRNLLINSLDSITWMENIKLFESLISWLSLNHTKFLNVFLQSSSDIWLSTQLDRRVNAHVFDDVNAFSLVRSHVFFGHLVWTDVQWLGWLVLLLVFLDVFNQVKRTKHTSFREFVESLLASVENEFFLLHWKLFTGVDDDGFELFLVVGLVEVDERLEVIQISLSFGVENLILVSLHLQIVSKFSEFSEEILALFLLNEELTIFNVEVEDSPAICLS